MHQRLLEHVINVRVVSETIKIREATKKKQKLNFIEILNKLRNNQYVSNDDFEYWHGLVYTPPLMGDSLYTWAHRIMEYISLTSDDNIFFLNYCVPCYEKKGGVAFTYAYLTANEANNFSYVKIHTHFLDSNDLWLQATTDDSFCSACKQPTFKLFDWSECRNDYNYHSYMNRSIGYHKIFLNAKLCKQKENITVKNITRVYDNWKNYGIKRKKKKNVNDPHNDDDDELEEEAEDDVDAAAAHQLLYCRE